RQISILGILSIGMTMVIVSGEFDLSVGATYGMAAMVAGMLMTRGIPIWTSILVALIAGMAVGFVNGLITTYLKVPSLIVTLGMLNIARGLALIFTGGFVIALNAEKVRDPFFNTMSFLVKGKVLNTIPNMTFFFIGIAIIGYLIYGKTILGFRMRAVGGNPNAAIVSGVNVKFIKIMAFIIAGLLAAFGGIINLAFLQNVQGTMGTGLELDVIAATIIGGTSLKGGEGTILGTIIGVLIMGVLRNGLVLLGVTPFLQMIMIGVVIIAAVAIDMGTRK
ncbi:MAG: ABC transporter permease, partial [Actinobacteria bacterium]|nr:ABC transporter permease [Actinomycetota bacterium]